MCKQKAPDEDLYVHSQQLSAAKRLRTEAPLPEQTCQVSDACPLRVYEPLVEDEKAVNVLKCLDNILRTDECRQKFMEMADHEGGNYGVRHIQGGRLEVFIQARGKASRAFEWVCQQLNDEATPQVILDFCRRQAFRDDRVSEHRLGNFSLLISYEGVPDQVPHIDLLKPNHQFGIIVTDGAAGTKVFAPKYRVQTSEDLQYMWPNTPGDIVEAIENSSYMKGTLQDFGDVLCPVLDLQRQDQSLPTGSCLSLPGGVIHGGPQCDKYRAVLFFSGCPKDHDGEYNPDMQYFASLLVCDIIRTLWKDISGSSRRFLLKKLARRIRKAATGADFYRHLDPGSILFDYCWNVTQCNAYEVAAVALKCSKETDTAKPVPVLSETNLWTEYEGGQHRIAVYLRSTGSCSCLKSATDFEIVLKYVDQQDQWEGVEGEPYMLHLHKAGTKFNGSNGKIIAPGNEIIPCFQKIEVHETP